MKIAHIDIGANSKPFIIAEMSGNHNQSIDKAIKIIEVAAGNIEYDATTIIDANGKFVTPGFIDIHVHGGGGDLVRVDQHGARGSARS